MSINQPFAMVPLPGTKPQVIEETVHSIVRVGCRDISTVENVHCLV